MDACGMDPGNTVSHSGYSVSADAFTCGPSVANLMACKYISADQALCISGPETKEAVRFMTNKKKIVASSGGPGPLRVTLTNGTVCTAMSHDQGHHYENRMSWLYCGYSGVLLLPKNYDTSGSGGQNPYFDKSKPLWTAQLSENEGKPTTVGVASVTYSA